MTETHLPTDAHAEKPAAVEHGDISIRGVLIFMAILFVGLHVVCGLMILLFNYLSATERQAKKSRYPLAVAERAQPLPKRLPKEPRLEGLENPWDLEHPEAEGDLLTSGTLGWPSAGPEQRTEEEQELNRPAWADRDQKAVRLPIDLVMKRLVPSPPPSASESAAPGATHPYQTPSAANSGRGPVEGER
jgi:hypothetical protein